MWRDPTAGATGSANTYAPQAHPHSVWLTTAEQPPLELPRLSGDVQTEVAIIGGGFTGLAAAHHLSRAGVACAVLEANDIGWGASGRNGGMAVLRYKKPWAVLGARYGEETALRLHGLLLEAVDTLEATVAELGIACGFSRYGHLTAANGRKALDMLAADAKWLAAVAGDRAPRLLDATETATLCGTSDYLGGYLDPRAAGIHPLDYARGLAAGLRRKGVPLYAATPVQALAEDGSGVTLTTAGGSVRAKQALIGTNAYTALHGFGTDLGRRVVPVSTSVVTTAPLPETLWRTLLPQGHLVSDTRHLLNYFRRVPGGRLLYGGRGSLTGRESPEVYAGLEQKLRETFPALAGTPIDHRWSGKVAVTLDDFPHLGRASPRVAYAMGYGGRGVALTNLLGKLLAKLAVGEVVEAGPMSANAFGTIPFHSLRVPAMKTVAGYYRVLDALKV
jgi:glycine/D-amino acid oxidase-like deaminating enzyme